MTVIQDNTRRETIKLCMCLVYVFVFLSGSGWVLLNLLDEGPDLTYTPPAYSHHR